MKTDKMSIKTHILLFKFTTSNKRQKPQKYILLNTKDLVQKNYKSLTILIEVEIVRK